MSTLLEALQKRLAQSGQAQTPPAGQQQQLTQALRSGTGKAGTTQGARQSSLGEQSAQAQAGQQALQQQQQTQLAVQGIGQQAQEVQQREQLAGEQLQAQRQQTEQGLASRERVERRGLAAQEQLAGEVRDAQSYMKINQMTQKYDQGLQELATKKGVTLDNLFANYNRERANLELDQKQSDLNQALFNLTFSNRKYIDTLEDVGARQRIQSAQDFQREMQNIVFGDTQRKTLEEYGFLREENQNERDFKESLAQMGIDAKMAVYNSLLDANRAQFYGAAAQQVGGAAISAAQKSSTPSTQSGPPTAGPGMTASPR